MKKLLIIALLGFGMLGIAQKKNENREKLSDNEKVEKMSAKMQKSLNLTDAQTKEVQAILLKRVEKNNVLREKIKIQREERKKTVEALKTANSTINEELKKVLTKEQLVIFEKNVAERKEKLKEKRAARRERKNKVE